MRNSDIIFPRLSLCALSPSLCLSSSLSWSLVHSLLPVDLLLQDVLEGDDLLLEQRLHRALLARRHRDAVLRALPDLDLVPQL